MGQLHVMVHDLDVFAGEGGVDVLQELPAIHAAHAAVEEDDIRNGLLAVEVVRVLANEEARIADEGAVVRDACRVQPQNPCAVVRDVRIDVRSERNVLVVCDLPPVGDEERHRLIEERFREPLPIEHDGPHAAIVAWKSRKCKIT